MIKNKQNGFSIVEVLIVIVIFGVVGFVGWRVLSSKRDKTETSSNNSTKHQSPSTDSEELIWRQTEKGWEATQKVPMCPTQPMLKLPADLSKVTSVLYPGQTRGGNYKPHGGLRFDTIKDNSVTVTAPIDGYIVRGAQYLAEGTTEVQYTFDVMNNCGIMYRVGHLRVLPANLQKLADTWPAPSASSATQQVSPAVYVKQGDVLATKVGITSDSNTFFDWGVYDYRQENEASKSSAYQTAHAQDKELSWHAVCWLKDWLPAAEQTKLAALPAGDPSSAKNSDYCK